MASCCTQSSTPGGRRLTQLLQSVSDNMNLVCGLISNCVTNSISVWVSCYLWSTMLHGCRKVGTVMVPPISWHVRGSVCGTSLNMFQKLWPCDYSSVMHLMGREYKRDDLMTKDRRSQRNRLPQVLKASLSQNNLDFLFLAGFQFSESTPSSCH